MRMLLRNGAAILLVFSCIVFVGLLTYQFLMLSEMRQQIATGMSDSPLPAMWLAAIGAISSALSAAALPFFGACAIDRLDQLVEFKEAAE